VGGINDWIAKGLGKGKTVPITPAAAPPVGHESAGSGRIHVLDTPTTMSELVEKIKQHMSLSYGTWLLFR
jgi:putative NIF3 family GTP cyclohydrolase 1 type 2